MVPQRLTVPLTALLFSFTSTTTVAFAFPAVTDTMGDLFQTLYFKLEKKVASNSIPAIANPKKRIDIRHSDTTGESFDHSLWNDVLQSHVTTGATLGNIVNANAVDYVGMGENPKFRLYLEKLAKANVSDLSQREQLALWMNAYNALCISVILQQPDPLSITSITDIKDEANPVVWDRPAGMVGGESFSLNAIEHEKLRNSFCDPRIHACIVCASASCPDLRREAFTGNAIESQMQEQVELWLQNPTKGSAIVKGKPTLSRIFLWFADDFGGLEGVKGFCAKNSQNQALKTALLTTKRGLGSPVRYFHYDWQMNRAKKTTSTLNTT